MWHLGQRLRYPTLNKCPISHWIDETQILQAALILTVPTGLAFNVVTEITFIQIFIGFLRFFSEKAEKAPPHRGWIFQTPGVPAMLRGKAVTLPYRPVLSACWDRGAGVCSLPAAIPGLQRTLDSWVSQIIAGGSWVKLQSEKRICTLNEKCSACIFQALHFFCTIPFLPASQWLLLGRLLVLFPSSAWGLCKPAPLRIFNDTLTLPALSTVADRWFSEVFVQSVYLLFFCPSRDLLTLSYWRRWEKRCLWQKE